ncbi:hypothetical protein SELMODRAFT_117555 [Selaginella moellendorffii]|uniref:Uncharacterized protein n=1 Tax=Selaginella moellendorffii TaxID=88036 RepID=D8SIJ0_SELML|nr:transcription factor SRM1 [Selaginella moellendorffii]EFJ15772.1 hypothetical protein SELMODRAFT_117555 [Selaginella moellendorffii]|eukprot:XP_002982963.1 transcription factor SRM1 [Selaginella moellendorffii]
MPEELGISPPAWSAAEIKLFESALSVSAHKFGSGEPNWEKFHLPGKQGWELKQQYDMLVKDVAAIEAGLVAPPNYIEAPPQGSPDRSGSPGRKIPASIVHRTSDHPPQERRKGIPWSEDEHKLFLIGLEKYGKGDWRSISRKVVITRTPTQVASHAQKYFNRLASKNKDKRRNSIHDITSVSPPPLISPHHRPMHH